MPHDMVPRAAGCRWYVIQAVPSKEYTARRELQKRGFEVFLPECTEVVKYPKANGCRRPGAVSRSRGPLFTGYLFARFDASCAEWGKIEDQFGVITLLRFQDALVSVADDEIEDLQAKHTAGIWIELKGREWVTTIGEPARRHARREARRKHRISMGNLHLVGRVELAQLFLDRFGLAGLEHGLVTPA